MLDAYLWGHVDRISPEAPGPCGAGERNAVPAWVVQPMWPSNLRAIGRHTGRGQHDRRRCTRGDTLAERFLG